MKKFMSIIAIIALSATLCTVSVLGKNYEPEKDKTLATVGEVLITEEDVSLIQDCDALINSLLGVRSSGTSEREALERAISEKVKREMIREKGLSLSDEE